MQTVNCHGRSKSGKWSMVMQWAHLAIERMLSRLRACQCCHLHYVAQYRRTRSRLRTVVCWTRKWHHLLQRRVSGRGLINQLHCLLHLLWHGSVSGRILFDLKNPKSVLISKFLRSSTSFVTSKKTSYFK